MQFAILRIRGDGMKLVIFSDVHGKKTLLERIMRFNPDADNFLSLGDTEMTMDYLLDLDIIGVKGNYPRDPGLGYEHYMTFHGKKFMMTHGHKYKVQRGLKKLVRKAFDENVDVVLYGHTHIAQALYVNDVLLLNPGSVYRPRNHLKPSYCIMNIDKEGTITYEYRDSETNMQVGVEELREQIKH